MITGVVHTEEGVSFPCVVPCLYLVKYFSLSFLLSFDRMLLAIISCILTIDVIDQISSFLLSFALGSFPNLCGYIWRIIRNTLFRTKPYRKRIQGVSWQLAVPWEINVFIPQASPCHKDDEGSSEGPAGRTVLLLPGWAARSGKLYVRFTWNKFKTETQWAHWGSGVTLLYIKRMQVTWKNLVTV